MCLISCLVILTTTIRSAKSEPANVVSRSRDIHNCKVLVYEETMFTKNLLDRDFRFDVLRRRKLAVASSSMSDKCFDVVETPDFDSCVEECITVVGCMSATFFKGGILHRQNVPNSCHLHRGGVIGNKDDAGYFHNKDHTHAAVITCVHKPSKPIDQCGVAAEQYRPKQILPSMTGATQHAWSWFTRMAIYIGGDPAVRLCGAVIVHLEGIKDKSDIVVVPASCVTKEVVINENPSKLMLVGMGPGSRLAISSKWKRILPAILDRPRKDETSGSCSATSKAQEVTEHAVSSVSVGQSTGRTKKPLTKLIPVDAKDIRVSAGKHNEGMFEPGEQHVMAARVVVHSDFSYSQGTGFQNDIAIVKLSSPFHFSDTVRSGCIPNQGETVRKAKPTCAAIGWSCTARGANVRSGILHQVVATIKKNSDCKKVWENLKKQYMSLLSLFKAPEGEQILCTDVKTVDPKICIADQGAAVVCQDATGAWTLQGLASFVPDEMQNVHGRPGDFVRVSKFANWIKETAEDMTNLKKPGSIE